jgi:copper chaperone
VTPSRNEQKFLPVTGDTRIGLGVLQPGQLDYACGMAMHRHHHRRVSEGSIVATTAHVFRVEGMHCGSCALLIDDSLEGLFGVHGTQTTVKSGRAILELDTQSSPGAVIHPIEELGYRASLLP